MDERLRRSLDRSTLAEVSRHPYVSDRSLAKGARPVAHRCRDVTLRVTGEASGLFVLWVTRSADFCRRTLHVQVEGHQHEVIQPIDCYRNVSSWQGVCFTGLRHENLDRVPWRLTKCIGTEFPASALQALH